MLGAQRPAAARRRPAPRGHPRLDGRRAAPGRRRGPRQELPHRRARGPHRAARDRPRDRNGRDPEVLPGVDDCGTRLNPATVEGRPRAAWPRASARRCSRSTSTTRTASCSHRRSWTTCCRRSATCPPLEMGEVVTPSPFTPARRQGLRRGRDPHHAGGGDVRDQRRAGSAGPVANEVPGDRPTVELWKRKIRERPGRQLERALREPQAPVRRTAWREQRPLRGPLRVPLHEPRHAAGDRLLPQHTALVGQRRRRDARLVGPRPHR